MTDTERTVVKTYLPAYQKAEWVEHADELDMSHSEYVRTMVQAGRRDFEVDPFPETDGVDDDDSAGDGEDGTGDATAFEERVYDLLTGEPRTWDDLLDALTEDVEERLEDALQDLQAQNRVVYSGRAGGYEAVEE